MEKLELRKMSLVEYVVDWSAGAITRPYTPKDHYSILGIIDFFIAEWDNALSNTPELLSASDLVTIDVYKHFRKLKGKEWGFEDPITLTKAVMNDTFFEDLTHPSFLFYATEF